MSVCDTLYFQAENMINVLDKNGKITTIKKLYKQASYILLHSEVLMKCPFMSLVSQVAKLLPPKSSITINLFFLYRHICCLLPLDPNEQHNSGAYNLHLHRSVS